MSNSPDQGGSRTPKRVSRRNIISAMPLTLAGAALLATPAVLVGMAARTAPPAKTSQAHRALARGGPWLNTPALTSDALQGKVVLVNFWTYSCINSLRPLPYLNAWADRYKDRGLVVVGVHSPEFGFEKDVARIRQAIADQDVRYPVLVDNAHAVWRAFDNSAWPGFYFIDGQGRLRRRILGEGGYDGSERLLQTLLGEARGVAVEDPILPVRGLGAQAAADWDHIRTPETYLGHARARGFSSPGGFRPDAAATYRAERPLALNQWALSGRWRVGAEAATLKEPAGAIMLRFHARDLHLVMAPGQDGRPVRFRILLDGRPPGRDGGVDVDADGEGRLDQARMYQLVRQLRPGADRTFQIAFEGAGASAFAFTFG